MTGQDFRALSTDQDARRIHLLRMLLQAAPQADTDRYLASGSGGLMAPGWRSASPSNWPDPPLPPEYPTVQNAAEVAAQRVGDSVKHRYRELAPAVRDNTPVAPQSGIPDVVVEQPAPDGDRDWNWPAGVLREPTLRGLSPSGDVWPVPAHDVWAGAAPQAGIPQVAVKQLPQNGDPQWNWPARDVGSPPIPGNVGHGLAEWALGDAPSRSLSVAALDHHRARLQPTPR